jgi:hypothetical protein
MSLAPGSLAKAANFVAGDAFVRALATPFKPEDTRLGEYTFVPWVRTGLAAGLTPPAGGALRATVEIAVNVQDDGGDVDPPVRKRLVLRGPADVIGIDPAQVVRCVPADGTPAAEESFLAHIEFDRPEMPWLFSPFAPAGDVLKPWLALVVCEASVSSVEPGTNGLPPQLRTRLGQLQPLADAHAWAHAQIVGPASGAPSVEDRLSEAYAPANLSRVMCPRKLDAQHAYIAALVPTFDCGVKAGLGLAGGTLADAWARDPGNADVDAAIVLPAYFTWRFSVGEKGDFKSLAERIVPVKADWKIGRRIIDASRPEGGLPDVPDGDPGRVQIVRCALVSPKKPPQDAPAEGTDWNVAQRDRLRQLVDAGGAAPDDLPRLAPRMYARYQRGARTIGPVFGDPPADTTAADGDWFPQLDTTPMHRIVAGVGTRVVRKDQEMLMQAAWLQVGEIRKVNDTLVRMQFGRFVAESLHRVHLSRLALGELAQVTRGVHDKLRPPGTPLTVYGDVDRSVVPSAALGSAFRRATRVRGPLARFADTPARAALRNLVARGDRFRDLRRTYAEPDGITTLSPGAIAALPPALIAAQMRVPVAGAAKALSDRLAARTSRLSVADAIAGPLADWKIPAGTLDLARLGADMALHRIEQALPRDATRSAGKVEALAPLLVGLVNSGIVREAQVAPVLRRFNRLPYSAPPRPAHFAAGLGDGGRSARVVGQVARFMASDIERRTALVGDMPAAAAAGVQGARIRFETGAARELMQAFEGAGARPVAELAAPFAAFGTMLGVAQLPRTADRAALAISRTTLLDVVTPARTMTAYAKARLAHLPPWLPADWFDDLRIAPIMNAPRFDRPMYEAVDAYDREWLVPGLGTIAEPDFVTVLYTNPVYTETMLVGLSDEMGRELLWRGFPTDQRGTYFHRFWNAFADELAAQIHRFKRTPLGTHLTPDAGGSGARVVLVIRGELLRRYPDAIVVAVRAELDARGKPTFEDPSVPGALARVLFHAPLPPDYTLIGFDLSDAQIQSQSWWFLIAEHPTAPRFGLSLYGQGNPPAGSPAKRDDLDWNDLGALRNGRFLASAARTLAVSEPPQPTVTWPGNAAVVAHVLLRDPVRAAFEAKRMLAGTKD